MRETRLAPLFGLAFLFLSAVYAQGQMNLPAGAQGSTLKLQTGARTASSQTPLVDVILTNGHLRARFVDNSIRINAVGDDSLPGYSGLASLVYIEQGRNLFAPAGLNYETCSTVPRMGQRGAGDPAAGVGFRHFVRPPESG